MRDVLGGARIVDQRIEPPPIGSGQRRRWPSPSQTARGGHTKTARGMSNWRSYLVPIWSLSGPDLVPSALCAVRGMSLSGGNPLLELTAWLRDKHILIVLDN